LKKQNLSADFYDFVDIGRNEPFSFLSFGTQSNSKSVRSQKSTKIAHLMVTGFTCWYVRKKNFRSPRKHILLTQVRT